MVVGLAHGKFLTYNLHQRCITLEHFSKWKKIFPRWATRGVVNFYNASAVKTFNTTNSLVRF
jgi:hypothetical protein